MFFHIGSMKMIREKDLLGIFDLDGQRISTITSDFLKKAESEKRVETVDAFELPKSFVLIAQNRNCREKKHTKEKVILSPISSMTLSTRGRDRII